MIAYTVGRIEFSGRMANPLALTDSPISDREFYKRRILDARLFAIAAHSAVGQVRKYTGEPYWHHCGEVAGIVTIAHGSPHMVMAAWLHDVVEDTEITLELIKDHFGDEVAELVGWLTDTSKPEDGNRAARKAIDRERLSRAPAQAQTIKVADLISNTGSIAEHDSDFAKVYMKEKSELLKVLTKANPELIARAKSQIDKYDENFLKGK